MIKNCFSLHVVLCIRHYSTYTSEITLGSLLVHQAWKLKAHILTYAELCEYYAD
jgi:hypothetical protein